MTMISLRATSRPMESVVVLQEGYVYPFHSVLASVLPQELQSGVGAELPDAQWMIHSLPSPPSGTTTRFPRSLKCQTMKNCGQTLENLLPRTIPPRNPKVTTVRSIQSTLLWQRIMRWSLQPTKSLRVSRADQQRRRMMKVPFQTLRI